MPGKRLRIDRAHDFLTGARTQEPQMAHGGIIAGHIIPTELKSERLHGFLHVDRSGQRRHSVVGNDRDGKLLSVFPENLEHFPNVRFIKIQFFPDGFRVQQFEVKKGIQFRRINKVEVVFTILHEGFSQCEIVFFLVPPVGDMVTETGFLKEIRQITDRSHSIRDEKIVFLAIIEIFQTVERHLVKLKISGIAHDGPENPGNPAADASAVPRRFRMVRQRQELEDFKRRVLLIIIVKAEMPMLIRTASA
ncbi:hypothetical protein SDC9_160559 [bioreactor metagenome]|uniref:Uncharacterized protein n=1 Tax=bioreactor metagenome TaxID=1076179 RepID=A0A645FFR8_9ZZZZ